MRPTRHIALPPSPAGFPAHAMQGQFVEDMSYKDWLAAHGLEFHTEVFDLVFDPVSQGGGPITAGNTAIAIVRITQEADFVSEKWLFSVEPLGASFTVQITDNATNRKLSNLPVAASNIAGTAQRPRIMKPRLWRRNSDVMIEFKNTGTSDITALQFVMSGYKIFDKNALNLNNPQ